MISGVLGNISGSILNLHDLLAIDSKDLVQEYLKKKPGLVIVLYPFDSPSFSQEVIERAGTIGIGLQKLGSDKKMANDIAIPYEIYRISFQ
jgi:hypothetical protein